MNQETTAAAMAANQRKVRRSLGGTSGRGSNLNPEYLEDLVGNEPQHRNLKGVAIAILVIMVVIGFIALSVILLTPENNDPVIPKISLNDVIGQKWRFGLTEGTWIGSSLVHEDMDGNVVEMSSPDQTPDTLIPSHTMRDNGVVEYKISEDGQHALLVYDKVPIYKYSYNASYYIYNIKTGRKESLVHDNGEVRFQFAAFGPNGSQIIYSLDGDLYYRASVKSTTTTRLTSTGSLGSYHNGIADWLYEEEILKRSSAFWWSPSGQYLAYVSFDDRLVEDSYVTIYTDKSASDVIPYKKKEKYKYPKAGYKNPIVNVQVIDLTTIVETTLTRPETSEEKFDIFHSLTWLSEDELLITWSDRTMVTSVMQQCSPTRTKCTDGILRQRVANDNEDENKGWLSDLNQPVLPSDDANIFFYILPSDHGGMGDFNHLALVNKTAIPSTIQFLTGGNWEVTKLLHYDAVNREVYYVSNERHPGSRHVYKVSLEQHGNGRKCITCPPNLDSAITFATGRRSDNESEDMTCGAKKRCLYYDASFGSDSDWCMIKCLGPCVPYTGVLLIQRGISDFKASGDDIEGFERYSVRITNIPTSSPTNMVVPLVRYDTVRRDGMQIRIKVLVPASMHIGQRPVVFFKEDVGAQTVDFRFKVDLASYIVTSIGAVAVFVDGRGSGYSGNRLLQSVAGNPGGPEVEDMKAVLDYLKMDENIDTESVGVVGGSGYGGYTAALAITDPRFKCGVARSPISDWKLYDSIGAERLLGSPSRNEQSYLENNLFNHIGGISESQLRIFHGLQDRKVNMQQSALLQRESILTNLPLEGVKITYHPTVDQIQNEMEASKIESYICRSISLFLRNCLFGNSDQGQIKLELLKADYGLPS